MRWSEISKGGVYEASILNSLIRVKFIASFVFLVFLLMILRVFELSLANLEEVNLAQKKNIEHKYVISRSDIVDRNGVLLASNIRTASIYAHPKQMIDKLDAAKNLSHAGIGLDFQELLKKFKSNKDFVWIKRHITPAEQQMINDLGIPGIYFVQDEKRVYPHEDLFSHVLGYVNLDGEGVSGIERLYNAELTNKETQEMQLSLDTRIQNILKSELQSAINMHSASGGGGIVMDANNGDILAMVSLPDFNPHNLNNVKNAQLFNQVTSGVYEMGSTFKPFTVATALDAKKIKVTDAFDVSSSLKIGKFSVNDYKGKGGYLSVPEILMYSSNLGVAQIARLFGVRTQQDYLEKFGFLSPVEGAIPDTAKPIFPNQRRWSDASLVTMSYGHGIAVTGIHLTQAMSALVNGGMYCNSTLLVANRDHAQTNCRRVIKEQTSLTMRKLLRLNVENGSAKKADIEGLLIGGKTGTAEKNKNGKYSKNLNLSLFVGAFPMNAPQYVVFVMLDEAKQNKINGGYTTGGAVAAPIAGNVIKRIAHVLGIAHHSCNDKDILKAMYLDYTPRYVTKLAKR